MNLNEGPTRATPDKCRRRLHPRSRESTENPKAGGPGLDGAPGPLPLGTGETPAGSVPTNAPGSTNTGSGRIVAYSEVIP